MQLLNAPRALPLAWLALCLLVLGAALVAPLDLPGPYFDELLQAGPALDFVLDDWQATHGPDAQRITLWGRPFPAMTASYMGALKCQLLIGPIALFGPRTEVVRLSMLALVLGGVACSMLWVRRVWDQPTALLTGLLLATDPNLVFIARHDWGAMVPGFLVKTAGLYALTRGWQEQRWPWVAAAGVGLGLAVYNKIDAVVFLVGGGAALLVAWRSLADGARQFGPRALAALGAGMALGLSWFWPRLVAIVSAANRQTGDSPQHFTEKLHVQWAMLDGTYFERLMHAGGVFARMFDAPDSTGDLRAWAMLAALVVVAVFSLGSRTRSGAAFDAALLVGLLLITLGVIFMPDATRIHHAQNVYPLPHVLVARAAMLLAGRRGGADAAPRVRSWRIAAGLLLVGAIVASGSATMLRTSFWLRRTGGTGLWSAALVQLADDVRGEVRRRKDLALPPQVVVSLEWGFHEQLQFLVPEGAYLEPTWTIRSAVAAGREAVLDGTSDALYLVRPEGEAVFGLGPQFMELVAQLPPSLVELKTYRDRLGQVSFSTVRLARPHRIRISPDSVLSLELSR